MSEMRRCKRCKRLRALADFYRDRGTSDGVSRECKDCLRERTRTRRQEYRDREPTDVPELEFKTCTKCGETKPVSDFSRASGNRDGCGYFCKACSQQYAKSYHRKLAARRRSEIPRVRTKRCSKCGDEKPVSEFFKAIGKLDGYRALCKECDATSSAAYRETIADRSFDDIHATGKKKCSLCGRQLPVADFNYCRSSPDGLAGHCRACGKEYKEQHYMEHQGDYYNRTLERRRKHPEQERAYRILDEAIKKGELIRPGKCSKCGELATIVAHHDDYKKPLDVRWLCLSCDRQLHADIRRAQRRGAAN
jgi:hypothetical protein